MSKKSISIIYFLIFIFCLNSQSTFSQVHIAGTVLNLASGEPVAYVNIGIAGKSIGTVSAETGFFELHLAEAEHEQPV